ncbi:UNVERIFIED_CONTAM: hypothetical protein GTU68_054518 [Idotea baltica]|nr:hypothetical protein [Idotea baltica]
MAGHIAAGAPTLAVEEMERVDFGKLMSDDEQFCLKVRGESMIEAHIANGDYAIIRRQSTANEGDIVAALVDGEDATLKYFYRDKGRYRLEPANSNMQPIYAEQVDILGILVGVIRQY